jgi:AraC-like DNA-binding protein
MPETVRHPDTTNTSARARSGRARAGGQRQGAAATRGQTRRPDAGGAGKSAHLGTNTPGLMFPGPLRFGAAQAEIRFDARYLALPLRRNEKALQQMLQRALPLTVLQYRRDRLLVQQVRQALATHPDKAHKADGVAALLNISARTLHLQLKEEGASLQGLKDEVRRERAQELLNRSDKPVKQIAAAAGFRNEKSFIRAFREWTGVSPGEFRRGVP